MFSQTLFRLRILAKAIFRDLERVIRYVSFSRTLNRDLKKCTYMKNIKS